MARAYNLFALSTLAWWKGLSPGFPRGCSADLSGGGFGAPWACRAAQTGRSRAKLAVPHGRPRWMAISEGADKMSQRIAEGTRNLRNPWVSVQDVVLNSLEPSTLPSQPLPELSHFYTHTHTQATEMSCSCRYGSCWCVTPWHKMMRSRQLTSFCQLHKSDHKNTCLHKKSLHQDMVCLFK